MTEIDRLVYAAEAQIGTAEDPPGSNNIKYNTAYYSHAVSGDAYPWCMVFVWWVFRDADLSELFYGGGKTASCTALMHWAQQQGRWVTGDYRRGDVLLYQLDGDAYMDHAGICVEVRDGRVVAVEGNTGDEVRRVERKTDSIGGAYRPAYRESTAPGVDIRLKELDRGDQGEEVKAMQLLLIGRGCSCGSYGADGDFGGGTESALRCFQRACGITVDGICGKDSWKRLLNG